MMQHKVFVNMEAPPCSSVDCEVDAKLGGKVHVQRHHSAKDLAEIQIRERMQDYDGDHSKAPTEIQNGESMQDYDGDHSKALTQIQNGESMQDHDGDHSKALTEIQIGESMQDYEASEPVSLLQIDDPRQRALNLLRDRARSTHSEKLAK